MINLSSSNLTVENILPYTISYFGAVNGPSGPVSNVLEFEYLITTGTLKIDTTLPDAICPTGNCTWPVTPTLAVCSECAGVNAMITNPDSSGDSVTYTLPDLNGLTSGPYVKNSSLTVISGWYINQPTWKLDIMGWPLYHDNIDRGSRNSTITNIYSYGTSIPGYMDAAESPFFAPATVFEVDETSREHLSELFVQVLAGNGTSDGDVPTTYASSDIAQMFWEASISLDDLITLAKRISDTVTLYMRTADPMSRIDPQYAPTVGVSVPLVKVRWAWMVYPVALQFGGLAFLGITMYATQRHRVRPWKGHRVPLLLAHLDEDVRSQAQGGLMHRTGLDDRVGAMRVRLEFDGDDDMVFRRVSDLKMQPL
ncbi:hypothetical protein MMC11_005668 [Xylographa trunciseda]|nr:hypothetical protein [Xylographa trunciseda]